MNLSKIFLGFVLCFIPFTLSAQRIIIGRITDADDGSPIPGVNVFIANTTVGTATDAEGNYQLQIPGEGIYRLTVSHVAYQSAFKDIEPGEASVVFDVALQTKTMDEVTISEKVRFRKYDIDLFWKTLLGEKPSKTIQPLNPKAVYYYFNSTTGKLKVTCRDRQS